MISYYYLVSSLPELSLTEEFSRHPYPVFESFVREELSAPDYRDLRLCFLLGDVKNLVAALDNSPGDFTQSSFYTQAELAEGLEDPDLLFPVMADFIREYRDDENRRSGPAAVNRLLKNMLTAVAENRVPGLKGFPRDYLLFEGRLKNLAAALTLRATGEEYSEAIVTFDHFSSLIAESQAADFGLGGELGHLSPLVEAVADASPANLERRITSLRWEWLDEQTDGRFFSAAAVQAAAIKFSDVERWLALSPEVGRIKLDELLSRLRRDADGVGREDIA